MQAKIRLNDTKSAGTLLTMTVRSYPSSNPRDAPQRDHGGGLDAAISLFGGDRDDWLDLSTGINPQPYPVAGLTQADWQFLPDQQATTDLIDAARRFWRVPERTEILPAPGASALIARIPALARPGAVLITPPTYNEHAAAFTAHGWSVTSSDPAQARVVVHPNNPDGRLCSDLSDTTGLTVIDESFCDVMPERSLIERTERPGTIVLKSFGKFWGLAGLRLGFAIADPGTIAHLRELTGPWAVSGPALRIGTTALNDPAWAAATRRRLTDDAERLDSLMLDSGAALAGGTSLFRLYHVEDAKTWHDRLARSRIWTRIFPYSNTYLRLGLPPSSGWDRLENAL